MNHANQPFYSGDCTPWCIARPDGSVLYLPPDVAARWFVEGRPVRLGEPSRRFDEALFQEAA